MKDIDKGFARFAKAIKSAKDTKLEVGLFRDTGKNDGVYIADYAYANEFGTEAIPSRPFLRTTFDENEENWSEFFNRKLEQVFNEKISLDDAISLLAEKAVDDVKNTISNRNFLPKLNEETIKKKGSSKTLVDTGTMRNSVSYRVKK